jgi:hypothetical protein
MLSRIIISGLLTGTYLSLTGIVQAAPSNSELQTEIEQLKDQNQEIMQRLNAATTLIEETDKDSAQSNLHIGGYGELHYNNWSQENAAASGSDKDEIDFHRFVLFFGYDFTDSIRFHSELELEHALTEDTADGSGPGEVELEQAYIEYDLNDTAAIKTGVFLVPVGIINETHEPPTFYGVERNPIENKIIPSTWWEAGAAYTQRFENALSLDLALHSGLNTSAASNYAVRSGRQKVAKANAHDLAYTLRVKYSAIPGLELATTLQHQADITQSTDATAGSATLVEAHAVWQSGPFNLRALYATWDLDGAGPAAIGADEQTGWYIEPAYRINNQWGVFARYNEWDNQAGDSTDSEYSQIDAGVNYWPHEDVVIKFDYQDQDAPASSNEYDGFNLGVGYQF